MAYIMHAWDQCDLKPNGYAAVEAPQHVSQVVFTCTLFGTTSKNLEFSANVAAQNILDF